MRTAAAHNAAAALVTEIHAARMLNALPVIADAATRRAIVSTLDRTEGAVPPDALRQQLDNESKDFEIRRLWMGLEGIAEKGRAGAPESQLIAIRQPSALALAHDHVSIPPKRRRERHSGCDLVFAGGSLLRLCGMACGRRIALPCRGRHRLGGCDAKSPLDDGRRLSRVTRRRSGGGDFLNFTFSMVSPTSHCWQSLSLPLLLVARF